MRVAPFTLLVAVFGFLTGCATTPPPLPAAYPDELPSAWLDALETGPCVSSIDARVRLRIDPPDGGAVNLDGDLRASLPDTLRLSGKVGVFRPVFQFVTVAGFSELLLHDARSYWIVPSDEPDWELMNPAAWRKAILWSLCPQSLLHTFRADDRGTMTGRVWTVSGTLVGTPYAVSLDIEPRSRSVRAIRLRSGAEELLTADLGQYRFVEGAWVPQRAALRIRQPDGMTEVVIELVGASGLGVGALEGKGLVQPPGWDPVFQLGLSLPADLDGGPTPR
ncbi:MAG: hypothetical protein R3E97_21235 [Candidatus Eisenbacteria bacterium]